MTGAPDAETGSILLIDDVYYQDVPLSCSATLGSGCDNAGLVFGYVDRENYWVKVYSNAQDKILIYEVSSGTWTQRSSTSYTITDDTPFTMTAEVRAGAADTYAGTVPGGQVGLWCGDSSDNSLDDFKCRDIAGPFEVDGRWFCNSGEVRVDNSNNNVLEAYGTDGVEDCIIRRGFRGDKFVATFKFKWNNDSNPGFVVRWLSPGDYLGVTIWSSDRKARLYKRQSDGTLTSLLPASGSINLTTNNWYEAKVVIDNDPADQTLQRLRFWVDTDDDGDYGDEVTLISTTAVDDVWSAGCVGLYRYPGGSSAQEYDDVKIGYDNNSDGDILDASDDIQVSDNFDSGTISLTCDNNGNLTDDGVLKHVYDGWNRLVKVNRYADGDTTTIATYAYLPDNRRASKVVTNCGIEQTAGDGGNTMVNFYYAGRTGVSPVNWSIAETRNGSNQATRQWVWGMQYVDELLFMDVNGDASESNDCDPDAQGGESTYDRRYFYHQDRNWNVVALSEYGDGVGTDAKIAERYAYTPYGEFIVLAGDAGDGELGRVLATSAVGNPFAHQGLPFDAEKLSYQNRHREYTAPLQRFAQRDPQDYLDGLNAYAYTGTLPVSWLDPSGLWITVTPEEDCDQVARSLNESVGGDSQKPFYCVGTYLRFVDGEECPSQGEENWLCYKVEYLSETSGMGIAIWAVFDDEEVWVDSFFSNKVDLLDLEDFQYDLPPPHLPEYTTRGEIWAHIVVERECGFDWPNYYMWCHISGMGGNNFHRWDLGQAESLTWIEEGSYIPGVPATVLYYTNRWRTYFLIPNGPVVQRQVGPPARPHTLWTWLWGDGNSSPVCKIL